MRNSYRRLSSVFSLPPLVLLTAAAVLLPSLVFAQNGTVAGTVTNSATSAPVANAQVLLCSESGGCFGTATNASGVYSRSVPAGTYYAYTSNSGLVNEIYNNVQCPSSACSSTLAIASGTAIIVAAGGTLTGIDFALDPGGSIAGSVTDVATGAPIANATVNIYARIGFQTFGTFVTSGRTDASGNYTASGLPTGTYYASTTSGSGYTNEIYDNILCPGSCSGTVAVQSGADIAVTLGQTRGGINFALTRGGSITGTITNASTGALLSSVSVSVWTRVGEGLMQVASGFTSAPGVYTVSGLPAGTYYIATTSSPGFIGEIYNNLPCVGFCSPTPSNPGTAISMAWGQTIAGIDFQLDPGGSMTGTVTDATTSAPVTSGTVTAYQQLGASITSVGSGAINSSGAYTISGLPSGSYFAVVNTNTHIDEVYNNIACGATCATATILTGTSIAVVAGSATPGIDFALEPGGSVSGMVTDATTSAPLAGVSVSLYTRVGSATTFVGTTATNSSGGWNVGGLPSGSYYSFTNVPAAHRRFANEIYNDVACPSICSALVATTSGTPIGVTAGAQTANINFALALSISPPLQPGGLGAIVNAFSVRLTWTAPGTGTVPTSYVIEAGIAPGQTLVTFTTTGTTFDVAGAPPGRFYLRVRAVNAFGQSPPSTEYVLVINPDGSGLLGAPQSMVARINGGRLTVTWADPQFGGVAANYILEVGSSGGQSNIATLPVNTRSFTYEGVPDGVYFFRVRSRTGTQISPPSTEVMLVVGNVPSPTTAPRNLFHSLSGSTLTLMWQLPLAGVPTGYIIEAGTDSGLSNIAVFPTGSTALSATFTSVPSGTYYVRVRAVNPQGTSVASNERMVVVP